MMGDGTLTKDISGEFLSKEFSSFYEENGVQRELAVVEMDSSMMENRGVLKCFLTEVVATVVYFLNISPSKAVLNKTPYDSWRGNKPNVSHLGVFGCISYALIISQVRRKLDEKCDKCIFVGYNTQFKAYKLYNILMVKLRLIEILYLMKMQVDTLNPQMKVQTFNCCLHMILLIKSMLQIPLWLVHRQPY